MRVTFGTKYNQMNYYQGTMQSKLTDMNTKIASGLKIQYGYQDSSVFNQNLKLEYEKVNLDQGIDVSNYAHTSTLNTDKALSELSQSADQFNTKLIQAANDIHSPTSREAIARDLEKLKEHMINIANTAIGGEFLFAGSNVKVRPFEPDGTYKGNGERLEALVSNNNPIPYNITGEELFFGRDSDHHKSITTNIRKFNQTKLNNDIMDRIRRGDIPEEVYIKPGDTLRDLLGDNDDDTSNNGKEYFYLRGVRPDGSSFKSKFEFDVGYKNVNNATKVQDLLDRIGKEFGNTSKNKVVDVGMNFWGEIEIKNLQPGNANLDFHLISSDVDVENLDDLPALGARVTSFQKSPFMGAFSQSSLKAIKDNYDHRNLTFPSTFLTKDNFPATLRTKLKDVLAEDVSTLLISGTRPNRDDGSINEESIGDLNIQVDDDLEVQDLLSMIKQHFGGNIEGEIIRGQLVLRDMNVSHKDRDMMDPPFNGPSGFSLTLTTLNQMGLETKGLRQDYKSEYDRLSFDNQGSKLISNVSQILSSGMGYANEETKLSSVAGGSLDGQTYNLALDDHNGIVVNARIEFSNKGSYLIIPNADFDITDSKSQAEFSIPLYNPHDEPPAVSVSKADDVTYRQLLDAISIALNYSNQSMDTYKNAQAQNGVPTQEGKKMYEAMLEQTKGRISAYLSRDGRIEIADEMRSVSRMKFMIYDSSSNDFSEQGIRNYRSSLTFNANNALVIDEPDIDFFHSLDGIIQAVRSGVYRPDAYGEEYTDQMRNKGIQNGIELFGHLKDHIEKMIALNGTHGRSFENVIRRNEVLRVQIESIKSDVIGTDIAQTYNHFSNLTTNYNAVLASTSRINQMSLVNYL
ncbi:flagellar hook-associated protein FlgL [Helicobacter marmotae]|uniref:Flagellar hook-associated protein FlgL n=1 Tax=Helicobacter marmotae TaxID=152490 RepID=A0A3D8I271_9HELI|nr:flagellar hook-associated protein FlgL [Helicobacter marmotae]RDU59185.1 flagellar hook-associated protein FlgL [Helicobacter marmotae]